MRWVIALGLALALGSCAPQTPENPLVSGYPASLGVPEGAVSGSIMLHGCRFHPKPESRDYAADCGVLVVPEDRRAAGSRLIALPLIRVRALKPAPEEPIFLFEGGPGRTNVEPVPLAALLQRHDVVMVGYRGVDGSVTLDCPEVADGIARAPGPLMEPAALDSVGRGAPLCAARLERQGIDLGGYSMPETVDDQEAARRALGYGPIDLLGESYGTRLEMIYMWRYPASLARVVMIGANPPGHFVWDPALTDAKLSRYAALCAQDAYCRGRTPDLMAAMRQVSARMPKGWLGVAVEPDRVRLLSFFMLHESIDPGGAPVPLSGPAAIDAWLAAAHGDASGLALLSVLSHAALPSLSGHWGEFMAMGSGDYAALTPDRLARLDATTAVIGAPDRFFWALAHGWPASPDQGAYTQVQPSAVETLVIGGTLDATTPVEVATAELMPKLSRGHLVSLAEIGHANSFWATQPAARDRLLASFVDTGRIDASLYRRQLPDFRVDNGLPHTAHVIAVIGGAVAILALLALVGLAFRIGRRRARQAVP
jgi:pimeloyl-ACP methyl ester carboxylesterase